MRHVLIAVYKGLLTRAAVLDDGVLATYLVEHPGRPPAAGRILVGVVAREVPGIAGLLVDLPGKTRGVLPLGDILTGALRPDGALAPFGASRPQPGPPRPPPAPGTRLLVQISREAAGRKLPRLTTDISLPGQRLVLRPYRPVRRISRTLPDGSARDALHDLLRALRLPPSAGLIVRSAGVNAPPASLAREAHALVARWQALVAKVCTAPGPRHVWSEPDLALRIARDHAGGGGELRITTDCPETAARVEQACRGAWEDASIEILTDQGLLPLFRAHRIEKDIESLYNRELSLPSGGRLVIDYTEALVAVDVDSGPVRKDAGQTALHTNLEAAEALMRQLRLRDVGGLIVCDFIGMRDETHRRALDALLVRLAAQDPGHVRLGEPSRFGFRAMTRRVRGSAGWALGLVPCRVCGAAAAGHDAALGAARFLDALRAAAAAGVKRVSAKVSPAVMAILAANDRFRDLGKLFGSALRVVEAPVDAAPGFEIR